MKMRKRGNFKRTKKSVSLELLRSNLEQHENSDLRCVILMTSGCYSPPHNFHVLLLKKAKEYLESKHDFHVVGGFICPAAREWLLKKYGGDQKKAVSNDDRKTLLNKLIDHFGCSKWLSVDSTDMIEDDFILSFHEAILTMVCNLKHFAENRLGKGRIHKYLYVCGSDLFKSSGGLRKVREYQPKEFGVVAVARPGYSLSKYKEKGNLYIVPEVGLKGCSSTAIRKQLEEGEEFDKEWMEKDCRDFLKIKKK